MFGIVFSQTFATFSQTFAHSSTSVLIIQVNMKHVVNQLFLTNITKIYFYQEFLQVAVTALVQKLTYMIMITIVVVTIYTFS